MPQCRCRASAPLAFGFGRRRACPTKFCRLGILPLAMLSQSRLSFVVPVRFTVTIGDMKKIISTNEAPAAIGPYSQAVRSGSFLFCSGQIPLDPKSGEIVPGDITVQTQRVLDNIAAVLTPQALSSDNAVRTLPFLTIVGHFLRVN